MTVREAAIATLAAASIAVCAAGQAAPAEEPDGEPTLTQVWSLKDEAMRRNLYQLLEAATVSVAFDRTPARAAFDHVRRQTNLPLIGRYADDPLGYGLDPETPITLEADDQPARDVLEEMLEQCGMPGATCTWQIRKGFIEFGTKARLSVPAARETRTHYIADLIIRIPGSPYSYDCRELNACELMQDVCETIEPGEWDYGQAPTKEDEELYIHLALRREADAARARQAAPDQSPPPPQRYVPPARIAIIRYWRDVIIVHAPDYFHRQIGGYSAPTPAAP